MSPSSKPPAGDRRVAWALFLAALLASGWLIQRAKSRGPAALDARPVELLGCVPAGPALLVTAAVSELGPEVAEQLLAAGGAALLGLRERCGFEPLLGLRRVAFATPYRDAGAQGEGDFAFIAETSLEQEPVLRCAEAVIRKRGGRPVRTRLGAFVSMRDQAKPLGEVAIRADGLFVLSGGQYFRDVIDATGGDVMSDEAARLRSRVHASIRRKLGASQLALTLLPGASWPLPGVQALGLGLSIQRELGLRGFVGCTSEASCVAARPLIENMKAELAKDPAVSGLASVRVEQHEAQLEISGTLPRDQLGPLLTQLISP
jgi:hypothetical protein